MKEAAGVAPELLPLCLVIQHLQSPLTTEKGIKYVNCPLH